MIKMSYIPVQVVYRPVIFRKDTTDKMDWFVDMLGQFFDNSQIDNIKIQK